MSGKILKLALAASLLSLPFAGMTIAAQKGTAAATTATTADTATGRRLKKSFGKLDNAVQITGSTVVELSASDCEKVGGKVETHSGCMKVGGNDVGLKCVVGGNHVCIDEANAN